MTSVEKKTTEENNSSDSTTATTLRKRTESKDKSTFFKNELKQLTPLCESPPTDHYKRRELYAKLELLRLDYEEYIELTTEATPEQEKDKVQDKDKEKDKVQEKKGDKPQSSSSSTSSSSSSSTLSTTPTETDPIIVEFNRLRALLALKPKRVLNLFMFIRMIAGVLYVLAFVPIFYISVPLRPFHILLRKFGIRNNYLPLDLLHRGFAKGLLRVCGITLLIDGYENLDRKNPSVVMFTHASSIDVVAATAACPIVCKFVAKKQLFYFPVIGWLLGLIGHVSIDRGNLTKAKLSLEKAVRKIRRWGRSIAISPEGTRSKSGLITDFKKGPFHLTKQVNLPITPIVMTNAFELWPHGQMWCESGEVEVHFMPKITLQPEDTVSQLSRKVHRSFLEGSILRPSKKARKMGSTFNNILALVLFYLVIFSMGYFIFF